MTLCSFRLCSPFVQRYFVLKYGPYLTQRCQKTPVDLYHFADEGRGFFVEVCAEYEQPLVLRSFVSSVPLENYENYEYYVQFPEEEV